MGLSLQRLYLYPLNLWSSNPAEFEVKNEVVTRK